MTCFPKIVIQNGGKNALWERRETGQWYRVKNLLRWWRLTVFLTTGIDSSLALWMTLNVPVIMTLFPSSVILNGVEKALREKRETEQWHGVKNLLPWMTSYGFPHHGYRSFAVALNDALPMSSLEVQILHVRLWWRLTFPSLWRVFPKSSFRTVVRMLCGKDGKRDSGTEWRIYCADDALPSSSPQA